MSLKINELLVENVLKCKFVKITANGDNVILEGENKQGKTAVLDSIEMLFGGGRKIPKNPIRKEKGKDERSRIVAKLTPDENGNVFIITRHWTDKNSYIKIQTENGLSPSSPQGWLKTLYKDIAFEPVEFLNKDKKEQVDIIKQVTGLDFSDLEEQYSTLYDDRKAIATQIKTLKGQAKEYNDVEKPKETEESVDAIKKEIRKRENHNREITEAFNTVSNLKESINEYEEKIEQLRATITSYEKEIKKLTPILNQDKTDTSELYDKLNNIGQISVQRERYQKKKNINKQLNKLEEDKNNIQNEMKMLKEEKKARMEKVRMPVENLDIINNELYYNGFPLEQASQAEQIDLTMNIAMALNPKLKIILIRTASLLDKKSWKRIIKIAKDKDFQVWLERVVSKPTKENNAFYIEDGGVKSFKEIQKSLFK